MSNQKKKQILEYIWVGIVLLVGYKFLGDKSLWKLFLITFVLGGLGALFINFFFDSMETWKKKKKEQN